MKLYLSSFRLGDRTEDLKKMNPTNGKVGILVNALDNQSSQTRKKIFDREREDMLSLGFEVAELDLREYFGRERDLQKRILDFDMIWSSGGNAFVLNLAMKLSGFRSAAINSLSAGNLVYAGYSAGAVVAGKSLKGIELVDKVDDFPRDYPNSEIVWGGLGFVDVSIVPHYESNHPESPLIRKTVDYLNQAKMPFRALRDGEVLIVS